MRIKKEDKGVKRKRRLQCEFENMGRECILLGDISPGAGEGSKFYCQFHYDVITKGGKDFNTYHNFSKWLDEYRGHFNLGIYGNPTYDGKGRFEGYTTKNQFINYDRNQLWGLMGNRE